MGDMIRAYKATSSGLTIATTAYTSGDVLGAELQFNLGEIGRGAGEIAGLTIIDAKGVLGAVDLFLFGATSAPAADNAPNAWTSANMLNLTTVISATTVYTSANNRAVIWQQTGDGVPYETTGNILYGTLVTRTANTFFTAVTDLQVTLFVEKV